MKEQLIDVQFGSLIYVDWFAHGKTSTLDSEQHSPGVSRRLWNDLNCQVASG